jgi:signal transduction histidine kinase
MSLKVQLTAVMAVIIILPFIALGVLVRVNLSTSLPGEPLLRYVRMNRIVGDLVTVDETGRLVVRKESSVPDWLDLLLVDSAGVVFFSTFAGLNPGSTIIDEDIAGKFFSSQKDSTHGLFIVEALVKDGVLVGAYAGRLKVRSMELGSQKSWFFPALIAYFTLLVSVSIGAGVIIGKFGVSVLRIETAAKRISEGDLDTPVRVKGSKELESLVSTLDRMRASLKEESERRVRFLAAVSHDLKTPLTAITGYIEALEDGFTPEGESLTRVLAVMRTKAAVLDDRISDLLDYARVSTGELRIQFEMVPLRHFLENLSRGYATDAELLGFRWEYDCSGMDDASVPLDRTLASRALENLVTNAFRYCPKGTLIRLRGTETRDTYRIEVTDSGPGIREEDLSRIFDPYYRGTTSRREEGSGLGLFITRSIVSSHGWTITVDSKPGMGTSFVISIPKTDQNFYTDPSRGIALSPGKL